MGAPMREILPDVWTWSWLSPPHGYHFNGYLLCLAGGNLCIDPAEASPEDVTEIARLGGARTAIHAADAGYAEGQGAVIDDRLAVGDVVGPLHVVGVAGKSPGEVAFHWPE